MRCVIGNGEPKNHGHALGQAGAVLFGERDHPIDQLAVTAVVDSGQVRENASRVGRVVGQRDRGQPAGRLPKTPAFDGQVRARSVWG